MARTVQQIVTQTTTAYVAAMAGIGITVDPTQWSRRNLQQLIIFIVSTAISIFEQIYDAYTADIEALIAAASPQTSAWFQAQMFAFQFSATTPQILQFNTTTFSPYYTTVNSSYQVIKYCSVVPGVWGNPLIKVAAADPSTGLPVALDTAFPTTPTGGCSAAAQAYVNLLAIGGIGYTVSSLNSDKVYIGATVYCSGLYSAVIQANVIAAINNYLSTQSPSNPTGIDFNGVFQNSSLVAAVRAAPGVIDFVLNNVSVRADAVAFVPGTYNLVSNNNEIARNFPSIAGYFQTETTAGYAITDSLTFIFQ